MKRSILLSGAALALIIGLSPALAQDRNATNAKQDQTTTEQNHSKTPTHVGKDEDHTKAGQRHSATAEQTRKGKDATTDRQGASSAKHSDRADKTKAGDSNKSANSDSDNERTSKPNKAASTDVNKKTPNEQSRRSKRADEEKANSSKSNKSADKPDINQPSKSASENKNSLADKEKSSQKSMKAGEANRNGTQAGADTKPKVRVSASLDTRKKRELHSAVAKLDVKPIAHVNFSVSVGTVVPQTVSLRPLPSTIVEIVPQYRGYDFFVARDEVIIVAPRTHKIVDVIERSGPSRASAESTSRHRVKLSAHQREIIRKHVSSGRTVTTGSAPTTQSELVVGETLPESVEVESFPEVIYRDVPEIRTYRYIDRGGDIYLVDPSDRRIIEEIR